MIFGVKEKYLFLRLRYLRKIFRTCLFISKKYLTNTWISCSYLRVRARGRSKVEMEIQKRSWGWREGEVEKRELSAGSTWLHLSRIEPRPIWEAPRHSHSGPYKDTDTHTHFSVTQTEIFLAMVGMSLINYQWWRLSDSSSDQIQQVKGHPDRPLAHLIAWLSARAHTQENRKTHSSGPLDLLSWKLSVKSVSLCTIPNRFLPKY